eukprot:CAMPEP_0174694818 /NCGR_PEP_ID=MMETSP1094-20130205/1325_1 /TAXON_ID=156173 /ORGANISM="Chrysochromulina brevifilum, Strain UTEX LB 985" /LENGTH=951 /DNA_ID=CAMNT_0015891157 /DNA_START=18 /DNA_END=2873 /DNA_ORIENTATION=-
MTALEPSSVCALPPVGLGSRLPLTRPSTTPSAYGTTLRGLQPGPQRRLTSDGSGPSVVGTASMVSPVMSSVVTPPLRRPITSTSGRPPAGPGTAPLVTGGAFARGPPTTPTAASVPGEAWGSSGLVLLDAFSPEPQVSGLGGASCCCPTASTDDTDQGDAEPETARLRGELLQMQQALHHTQAALVGKYRGQSTKCVSGAQFRTGTEARRMDGNNSSSKGKSQPPVQSLKCPECAALRTLLKRTKESEESARDAEQGLLARISESETTISTLNHALRDTRRDLSRCEAAYNAIKASGGNDLGAVADALATQEEQLSSMAAELRHSFSCAPAESDADATELEALRSELQSARVAAKESEVRRSAVADECKELRGQAGSLSARLDAERRRAEEALAKQVELEARLKRALEDAGATHARDLEERDKAHAAALGQAIATAADQAKTAAERERRLKEEAKHSELADLKQRDQEKAISASKLREVLARAAAAEAAAARAAAAAAAAEARTSQVGMSMDMHCAESTALGGALREAEAEAEAVRRELRESKEDARAAEAAAASVYAGEVAAAEERIQALVLQLLQARESEGRLQARAEAADEEVVVLERRVSKAESELLASQHAMEAAAAEACSRVGTLEAQVEELRESIGAQRERSREELERMRAALLAAERAVEAEAKRAANTVAEAVQRAEAESRQREAESANRSRELHALLEATSATLAFDLSAADAQLASQQENAASSSNIAATAARAQAQAAAAAAKTQMELSAAVSALQVAQAQASSAERAATDLRVQLERMTAHAAELDAEVDKMRIVRNKEVDGMRRASEATAKDLKSQLTRAMDVRREVEQHAATGDQMVAELQTQLAEALQSSVRLCVVAPTVNVTFGGQSLSSKAPLPKDKIRDTLESQVLPNFTRCFTQANEGVGPDGSTMDEWLCQVTASMQGSIERHLTKVFKE